MRGEGHRQQGWAINGEALGVGVEFVSMAGRFDDLDELRETVDVECKKAAGRDGKGKVPDDVWQTVSSMANTNGGVILLGVEQLSGHSFKAVAGIDLERLHTEFWSTATNPSKITPNVLRNEDVQIESVGGGKALVIDVPRASRTERPVYLNGNPMTGTYRRYHDGDHLAPSPAVRRMIADAALDTRDAEPIEGFGLDDFDPTTIAAFRRRWRDRQADHPFLGGDDEHLLTQMGALRRNRETGKLEATRAGLLMFGKWLSIREVFPSYEVDYREEASNDPDVRWTHRITTDGTWSGNLYDFYVRAFNAATRELKVPFRLDERGTRVEDTPVHDAVREALVNSLIHADYDAPTGITVRLTPGALVLRNGGNLRIPIAAVREGGHSDCRNQTLQKMFQMVGLGEKIGSGFPKITRAWDQQHWRAPQLIEDVALDSVELRLPFVSLVPEDALIELARRFGQDRFDALDQHSRIALVTALVEGRVTNARMRELSGQHPRDITLMFQALVRVRLLDKHGERSDAYYDLRGGGPEGGQQNILDFLSGLSDNDDDLSDSGSGLSDNESSVAPDLPRRVSRERLKDAVLELCRDEFKTVDELSQAIGRRRQYLLERAIQPLVTEGKLKQRFPESPTHPQQAYQAADA